jgi:hypothetical protein
MQVAITYGRFDFAVAGGCWSQLCAWNWLDYTKAMPVPWIVLRHIRDTLLWPGETHVSLSSSTWFCFSCVALERSEVPDHGVSSHNVPSPNRSGRRAILAVAYSTMSTCFRLLRVWRLPVIPGLRALLSRCVKLSGSCQGAI